MTFHRPYKKPDVSWYRTPATFRPHPESYLRATNNGTQIQKPLSSVCLGGTTFEPGPTMMCRRRTTCMSRAFLFGSGWRPPMRSGRRNSESPSLMIVPFRSVMYEGQRKHRVETYLMAFAETRRSVYKCIMTATLSTRIWWF